MLRRIKEYIFSTWLGIDWHDDFFWIYIMFILCNVLVALGFMTVFKL